MAGTGRTCDRTGTCTAAIITIITSTAATGGLGADTGVLECTYIDCALCTATTKVTGAECAHTGICGVATIITSDLAGSGQGVTDELVVTCTG